ncbi:hypothetical protein PR003_g18978 [Phytophthora rubi]|uniref:Uncharacterized protein n=1 Tax=Phytophthora rubi TaxID=129364 RepID=A0A6A4DZE8_9STRA|nr:hypothetical protein PR001_g7731 [Phytophthora rubi]KAE9315493.1 hypothetical protein PR003_g18978 [Phytophthora rubi]
MGRSRSRSTSRSTSRYTACLLGHQATHTVVQSANPVKVPLQALTRQGVVLLALRTSGPQVDSLLVKLPRQIPHADSQKVQVPADILEPLQAGLRILDASAKRLLVPTVFWKSGRERVAASPTTSALAGTGAGARHTAAR